MSYQKQGDLASVETLLERLRKTYGPTLPVVVRWEKQFEALAASKLEQAQELLERKQYREARRAISEMIGVASNAGPAEQILSQVQQQPCQRIQWMHQRGHTKGPYPELPSLQTV